MIFHKYVLYMSMELNKNNSPRSGFQWLNASVLQNQILTELWSEGWHWSRFLTGSPFEGVTAVASRALLDVIDGGADYVSMKKLIMELIVLGKSRIQAMNRWSELILNQAGKVNMMHILHLSKRNEKINSHS